MDTLIAVTLAVAVLAAHYWACRSRFRWLGAVLPVVWIATALYLWSQDAFSSPWDYVFAVIGFVLVLRQWVSKQFPAPRPV